MTDWMASLAFRSVFIPVTAKTTSAVTVGGLTSTTNTTTTTAAVSPATSTSSGSSSPRGPPGSGSMGGRSQFQPEMPSQVHQCLCIVNNGYFNASVLTLVTGVPIASVGDDRYVSASMLLQQVCQCRLFQPEMPSQVHQCLCIVNNGYFNASVLTLVTGVPIASVGDDRYVSASMLLQQVCQCRLFQPEMTSQVHQCLCLVDNRYFNASALTW